MATTCTTCGEAIPAGSRFCPSCGAATTGAIPVFDLGDPPSGSEDEAAAGESTGRDRTRATVAGLVLGVLVLLMVLSVVAGDESDEAADEAPEQTTSTTRPATTTTPPWRDDPDNTRLLAPGEMLDPTLGMAAVWVRTDGTVITTDLGTGVKQVAVGDLPVRPQGGIRWTGEAFLAVSGSGELFRLQPSGSGTWEPIETGSYEVTLWWPGHGPLLAVWEPGSDGGERPARVTEDGQLEVFDRNPGLDPSVYVDGRVAVSIDGAIYLLEPDGTPGRHAFGAVVGGADRFLVRRSCDETLACELVLDDIAAGTSAALGPVDPGIPVITAHPAPDGSAVAVVAPTRAQANLELRVVPVDGSAPLSFDFGQWNGDPATIVWTPDGDALLWRDDRGPSIRSIRWRGGEVSTEPSEARLADRTRPVDGYEGLFLVPLDAVPARWAPVEPDSESAAPPG